jgi:RHS repeat-associated protein
VEEFEYDMAGNRIKRAFNNITTSYDYDRRNRLSEKVEGGIQTSYQYDPQGNLIAEEGRYGTTRYTYDCFNRTASIQGAKGGYVQNRYDPEGLRYELLENGKLSRFIFSGGEVVTEVDANNSLKAAIVRGHEILAQKDVRDSSYYYLNNAHGDVVGLINNTGDIVNSYKYDAFGNTVEAKEQVSNRFRYAGEQFDPVTGQYYLRARFYNPIVGRFTQEDTYRGDGLNLYSYVQNNPIKYIDPSGYSCESKSNIFERGYRPEPGERSMTKAEYKEQQRLKRLQLNSASDELAMLPQLHGKKKSDVEKMLRARGYTSVTAHSGGDVWTKAMPDGNTMSVRVDPAMVRTPPRGFADEVPHAHKEIVPSSQVVSGNYHPRDATKYNDLGLPSTGPLDAHIPIRLR